MKFRIQPLDQEANLLLQTNGVREIAFLGASTIKAIGAHQLATGRVAIDFEVKGKK